MNNNEVVEHMAAAEERCLLCLHLRHNSIYRVGGRTCGEFDLHPRRDVPPGAPPFYSHSRVSDLVCNQAAIRNPMLTHKDALFCGRVLAQEPPCRFFRREDPRDCHEQD